MADKQVFDRIVVSREVMHGKPRIAVTQILDLLAAAKTIAEITSEDYFPDLTEADVLACIGYASQMIREDRVMPTS